MSSLQVILRASKIYLLTINSSQVNTNDGFCCSPLINFNDPGCDEDVRSAIDNWYNGLGLLLPPGVDNRGAHICIVKDT